jgi:type IX secretion system substrate protein/PKD domain-containing protein
MKHILLTYVLILLSIQLSSQSLTPTIIPMTSGQPVDMIESKSGHYYIGAYVTDKSEGFLNTQIEIVKTQLNGDTIWTRMIGGPEFDRVNKIIETKDGSLFILGVYTKSTEGSGDIYFLKMDKDGSILWEGTYGLEKSDSPQDVLETKDSTFIITGILKDNTSRFSALLEIDKFGKLENEYIYQHFRENTISYLAAIQLENEDLIVAGLERIWNEDEAIDNIALMRIHNLQDTVWTYIPPNQRDVYVSSLVQTSDTSFMISGVAYDSVQIPFVQTFHVNGSLLTSNDLNQFPEYWVEELIPYVDGTFLMTGNTPYTESDGYNPWIAQIDASGKLLDYHVFDGPVLQIPRAMCLNSFQKVIIFGLAIDMERTYNHTVLLELNPLGKSVSPDRIGLTCGKDSLIFLDAPYFGMNELTYIWLPENGVGEKFSSNPINLRLKTSEKYIVSISDGIYNISDTIFFEVPTADYQISFSADQQFFDNPPFNPVFENHTPQGNNLEFTWHFGDSDSLESNQKLVEHEYLNNGSYDVRLIAANYGCTDTLFMSDMIQCSGGDWPLSQFSTSTETLRVYPNPTSHSLTISSENPELRIDQIAIFDNLGCLITIMDGCESSHINLDVKYFQPGLYYFQLIRENKAADSRGKFIVE